MSEVKAEKVRAGNLTVSDKEIITELVSKYAMVIENKRSDTVTVKDKAKAWDQIAVEYSAVSATKRTAQQLKQVLFRVAGSKK